MDGIIPLQSACSAPKPIALLKNEIISEKAEALFDPIVPLHPAIKSRPKVRQRPVPRLAPPSRNRVQGSTNASEVDSRQTLSASTPQQQWDGSQTSQNTVNCQPNRETSHVRNDTLYSNTSQAAITSRWIASPIKEKQVEKYYVRDDSICSNISQATIASHGTASHGTASHGTASHGTASPVTEKQVETNCVRNYSVCSNTNQPTIPPHETASPVKETQQGSRRLEVSRRMLARRRQEPVKRNDLTMYDLIFYNPESNPFVPPDLYKSACKETNEKEAQSRALEEDESEEDHSAAVPQIKLGVDGEIELVEQTVALTTAGRKITETVREGAWTSRSGPDLYRRKPRTAEWSDAETVRFYRALAAIGTDFTLMEQLFPDRNRRDLKLKFKKEEKLNGALVDKALESTVQWDVVRLQEEFKVERQTAIKRVLDEREQLRMEKLEHKQRQITAKELRIKHSRCAKALGSSAMPDNFSPRDIQNDISADEIIRRAIEDRQKLKRKRKNSESISRPQPQPPLQASTRQNPKLNNKYNQSMLKSKKNGYTNNVLRNKNQKTMKSTPVPQALTPPSPGSIVVLTVNNPNSPSTKMLQTYVTRGEGVLTPVALSQTLLSSVVGYMQQDSSKGNVSARSSPLLLSPRSVANRDVMVCMAPNIVQVNSSPMKRQRYSSYTLTSL